MSINKILIIYKKELLDLMRDRRTVITSLVLPIILYPLLMIGFSSMMSRQETKIEQQQSVIYINDEIRDELSETIRSELEEVENLQVMQEMDFYDPDNLEELLSENSLQATVEIKDSVTTSGFRTFLIKVSYNKTNEKSQMTFRKINDRLDLIEEKLIGDRLKKIEIDEDILSVINLKEENIASSEQMLGFAIGKFLPYMLIMLTIAGASVIASDLVSGEKERGTLETILVSAAGRNELVIGKYLTIITISMITVLLNLFSMYLSFSHILTQSSANISELQFPISNFILILFLMIPLITFFSALLLSVSTYSRNIKEAQSYQMPIMFGGMILSMVSFLPGFELNFGFALIPIVNFSLLLRDIMLGSYVLKLLIITVMSMLILDVIVVTISVKLFNNESVLFRTAEEKSLKFWGKDKKNVFSVQFGILLFIIILFLIFYVGGRWQTESLINGLIKTELLIILAPAIIVLRLSKTNFKESFRMNYTKPVNFLLVLLMAIPVYLIATFFMQLVNFIYPIPETYLQNLEKLISIPDISIWMSLFIIAVLPGICEEILFRGYFMNVFKKHGFRNSIIITGILFGILHLDPFRMLPVTILGFWMGYLLLSTNSVFVPIFAHIINNSIALLLGKYGHQIPFLKNMIAEDRFPFWILIPAVIIFVVLLLLFRRINFGLTDKSNNYRSMIN